MNHLNGILSSLLSGADTGVLQALAALAIAYAGGIFSSLTPCIYPMIPITISVVGGTNVRATGAKREWGVLITRATAYVAGMTLVYSVLGVIAGLTGRMFGSFTNTSAWYIALGIIMISAALMMLDVVTIDPTAWLDRIKRAFTVKRATSVPADGKNTGFWGALVLGATSGSIAAPCTTPVLASILAFIASTQSVILGLGLMIAFSLGLSTILLLIAFFAGAVKMLPRSGTWMNGVKKASGLVLLAFGAWLFYRAGGMK